MAMGTESSAEKNYADSYLGGQTVPDLAPQDQLPEQRRPTTVSVLRLLQVKLIIAWCVESQVGQGVRVHAWL